MLIQESDSSFHQQSKDALTIKSNLIRSSLLEYSNKESGKFLKSPTKVNSISMQEYVEQFDSQTIEIQSQRFSSNNASPPKASKHNTCSILRIPITNYKVGNSLARNGSPKKKKIGKEKMIRFNKQIKSSPKMSIDSLNMALEHSNLDRSYDTILSGKVKEEEDDKVRIKEGINYLRHLSSTLKSRKSTSSLTTKSSTLGYITANIDTLSLATQTAFLTKGNNNSRGSFTSKSNSNSIKTSCSPISFISSSTSSKITSGTKANLTKSSSLLETMKTFNNIKRPINNLNTKANTMTHTSSLFKIKLSSSNS